MISNYNKSKRNGFVIFEFGGDHSGKIVIEDENYDDVSFILNTPNGTYCSKFRLNPELLKEDVFGIIEMMVATSINDKKHHVC